MKAALKNNWALYLILTIIILAQASYMTYVFANGRNSIHSDEPWSFGLANSTDGPYIFMTDDQAYMRNLFEWKEGQVLNDYVTVNRNERFDYENVWYNLRNDMHPPLYFSVLHTVCSLFPETYSMWYGFWINIIAFVIGQIFMYLTVRNMTDSRVMGVAGCVLWGGCVGALSMTLFIRHYGLSVMWIIILMYFYSRMMKRMRFEFVKDILPIAIVTYLGSMTNHYFTMFAFFFTGCFCIYFLVTKRFKTLAKFAFSILLAVGIMAVCVPGVLDKAFARLTTVVNVEERNTAIGATSSLKRANYDWQLRFCIYYVFTELFGIPTPRYANMNLIYMEYAIAGLLFLLIPLCYIGRKEEKFHDTLKNGIVKSKKIVLVLYDKLHHVPVQLIAMAVAGAGVVLITAHMISIPHMERFTDRYLSVMFPTTSMLLLVIAYKIALLIVRRRQRGRVAACMLIAGAFFAMLSHLYMASPYQFAEVDVDEQFISNEELTELTAGADCILGITQGWHLEMAPNFMRKARNFFAFETGFSPYLEEDLAGKPEDGAKVYFIFNGDAMTRTSFYQGFDIHYEEDEPELGREDVEEMIRSLPYCSKYDYVGYTYAFGGKFEIYELN